MEKQMYQGEWKCSGCGEKITELPFKPEGTGNLTCRNCYSKKMGGKKSQKQVFNGNWECHKCKARITTLPFEPKNTSSLICRDCYLNNGSLSK